MLNKYAHDARPLSMALRRCLHRTWARFKGPFWIIFFLTSLDQASKTLVSILTARGDLPTKVTFFLNVIYTQNTGISFGLLKASGSFGAWLLILSAAAIIVGLCFWYVQAETRWLRTGLKFIIAGAVGNMIDRLTHGGVIDFIDLHWRHYHFPTFNVADTMISLGTTFILWDALRTKA